MNAIAERPARPVLAGRVLVGGLGEPHARLLVAALRALGLDAEATGPLDLDAHDRGRSALPRGPCAPQLYTTGALLRTASSLRRNARATYLAVSTCGPCRFSLFPPAWERALDRAGLGHVAVVAVDQALGALAGTLGDAGEARVLEALVAADALAELERRLRPHVLDADALEEACTGASERVARAIEAGLAPVTALRRERGVHAGLARRPPAARGRIALVGEPWSLHVSGAPQLHLPEVLAAAGVEVEVPPLALWLALRAWELRERGAALDAMTRQAARGAADALGIGPLDLPEVAALAELAAPHHPAAIRGGYGFVELALAMRAQRERRAHAVISVKSFGCIPSSGLSDAIVPSVLARGAPALPFLALEVCADGDAARESRILLRAGEARSAAEAELARALEGRRDGRPWPELDPLASPPAPRPHACVLASAITLEGAPK
jgi:predicted nucleotide-binding protein (sugar kinase/HSP70/actin superfamily)